MRAAASQGTAEHDSMVAVSAVSSAVNHRGLVDAGLIREKARRVSLSAVQ